MASYYLHFNWTSRVSSDDRGGVKEDEVAALLKFWKKERSSIHDQLVKKSSWNDGLGGMVCHSSFRIMIVFSCTHVLIYSIIWLPAIISFLLSFDHVRLHILFLLNLQQSWRLDVLTKSRHVDELNTPAVIMEMKVDKSGESTDVVRFEMGRNQIDEMLTQVDDIEAQIKSLTA